MAGGKWQAWAVVEVNPSMAKRFCMVCMEVGVNSGGGSQSRQVIMRGIIRIIIIGVHEGMSSRGLEPQRGPCQPPWSPRSG